MTTSKEKDKTLTAYTAFNAVDEMVQKPVMGSDGAARWQNFRSSNLGASVPSVAPTAPLKAVDRAIFKSWQEERKYEEEERQKSGATALGSGYTHFAKKGTEDDDDNRLTKKERQRIQQRRRPDDKEYYIPSKSFTGWKFDYVFTTRDSKTGYFWDGMDSLKSLETTGHVPKVMILQESGENATIKSSEKKEDEKTEKASKPKKRKRPRGPEFVDDPTNPFQQLAERFHAQRQQQQQQQQQQQPPPIMHNLPSGWEAAYDCTSQKTYYYNRSTGERSWEPPSPVGATRTPPTQNSLPPGWTVAKDASTGKEYYYHALSQKTQWERPME
jgi:hypothetical protein